MILQKFQTSMEKIEASIQHRVLSYYKRVQVFSQLNQGQILIGLYFIQNNFLLLKSKHHNDKEFTYYIPVLTHGTNYTEQRNTQFLQIIPKSSHTTLNLKVIYFETSNFSLLSFDFVKHNISKVQVQNNGDINTVNFSVISYHL